MCTTPSKQKKNIAKASLDSKKKKAGRRSLHQRSPQSLVPLVPFTVDDSIANAPTSPLLRTFEEPQSVIARLTTNETAFIDLEDGLRTTLQCGADEPSTPSTKKQASKVNSLLSNVVAVTQAGVTMAPALATNKGIASAGGVAFLAAASYALTSAAVASNAKNLDAAKTAINTEVHGVKTDVLRVDQSILLLHTKVNGVATKVNNVHEQVTDIKTQVNNVQEQVTDLKTQVNNVQGQVTDIKTQVNGVETTVANLQKEVQDLGARFDEKFAGLEATVGAQIDEKFAGLEKTIGDIVGKQLAQFFPAGTSTTAAQE